MRRRAFDAPSRDGAVDGCLKIDQYKQRTVGNIARHFHGVRTEPGEDPEREGPIKTPERDARAMHYPTHGCDPDPAAVLRSAMFKEDCRNTVIVRDFEVPSLCEHHALPFFGRAHVARIPGGHTVGLPKTARVAGAFARRLRVRERLTTEIPDCIEDTLQPPGVAVAIEAQHLCMVMRGVRKQHPIATTLAFTGGFGQEKTRAEFIRRVTCCGD